MSGVDAILGTVAAAAPEIRDGLPGRRTETGEENETGDVQVEADVWADELLADRLLELDAVDQYASEEREDVLASHDGGEYAVALDPLDGSSNLQSNNPMGTVVGVYDAALPASGRHLVAAAYVLYGPITTMVAAVDGDVTEYVVEKHCTEGGKPTGKRRAVDEDVTLPADPVVYGFGGRVPDWPDDFREYAREIETELKLRYGGAMIADVSQVVTYGGVFSYPGLTSRPEGKLRVLFEGAPIAYVVESAGGASSDGGQSLLDVDPDGLHDRTPVHVGNRSLVERLEAALAD